MFTHVKQEQYDAKKDLIARIYPVAFFILLR